MIRPLLARDARAAAWAAALGAAIVVLVGLPLSGALNIWIDEAFTLHTTGAGPLRAWLQAITFEGQPPLYFVVESIWRLGDERSIGFARIPSVLFAAGAVAAIVGAAARIAPRVPPFVVALVTAANPIVIWAAVEMRGYALLLFIGAALAWTFFAGFLAPRSTPRARLWYVCFAIAGLYTQYYVGFVVAAQFITLLTLRRAALRAFAGSLAIVALAFAPFISVALMHVATRTDFVSPVTLLGAVHVVTNAAFAFVLPHDYWSGAIKLAGLSIALIVAVTVFAIGRPALAPNPARAFVAQWFFCLAVLSLALATSGVPADPVRHLIVLAPSSLLVALLLMSSLTRMPRLTGSIAATAFTVFALAQFWSRYHAPLEKPGEWQRVAATISADDAATPVAVFPAELAIVLRSYLPVATIPIPKPMPFTIDYVRATTLTDEAAVSRVLDPVQARSARLWLVTSGECSTAKPDNYDYHCRFMEAYLARRYRVARSVNFRGALARLYVRRPATTFAQEAKPWTS